MKNLSLVVLGAALGFGAMALTGGGASAAALQPFQPLAHTQQNMANDGMIQLTASNQDRRMRPEWRRDRDGDRSSRRNDRCRHYHRGHYYETPWWTLPLIIGGSIAANNYDDNNYDDNNYDDNDGGYGNRHVEW